MARLVEPRSDLESSYRGYIDELTRLQEERYPFTLDYEYETFGALVERLQNDSNGIGLADWQAPATTYWLLDDRNEIVAVSNLRHILTPRLREFGGHIGFGVRPSYRRRGYGEEILRETLKMARTKGIADVLVTCDRANAASARVIVKNGGVLEDERFIESLNEVVQRYWIRT